MMSDAREVALPGHPGHLAAGWTALRDGAWENAQAAFEAALHQEETAEALPEEE